MKSSIVGLLAVVLCSQAGAADAPWLTDLPAAQAKAQAENKIVLVDFDGSDWCPACIQLQKKVFSDTKFAAYAATNFVLLHLDYPQDHPQPEALKKANDELLRKYNEDEVYPLLVLLDAQGKEVGRHKGYDGRSTEDFIALLEGLKTGK